MTAASMEAHVAELRRRLVYVLLFFAVAAVAGFLVSSELLAWLQQDLALELNALTPYAAFYTQVMVAALIGLFATLPFALWQLLRFAAPGLTRREYRTVRNYLPFSLVLFGVGAVFAYQVIVKNAFRFFSTVTEEAHVAAVWGLQDTIGFVLKLSAMTGVLFQLPVAAAVLGRAGLVTADQMRRYRVYVFVGVLLLAALATPPDILTQLMVTLPVMLLYELSVWLVERLER